jgi:thymidylate synthase
MKTYKTIHEAYLGSLQDVYLNPDYRSSPRGFPCREKTDYTFRVLEPTSEPILTLDTERNNIIAEYTHKEVELYNSCTNKASDFAKASKFWEKLANPDGTVNSAYGYLIWKNRSHGNSSYESGLKVLPNGAADNFMRTPWEWAKLSLIQDKDTRQAIVRFSLPEHFWVGNKDFTCTTHANFLIREDKLNLSVVMRSNDLVLGLVYDMPWFVSLLYRMRHELSSTYPNLEIGSYTHHVHSLHTYDRDSEKILRMLRLAT